VDAASTAGLETGATRMRNLRISSSLIQRNGAFAGATEQAAEIVLVSEEISEKHPSGPKGRIDLIPLMARLKSCPFKTASFSATCEVIPLLQNSPASEFFRKV